MADKRRMRISPVWRAKQMTALAVQLSHTRVAQFRPSPLVEGDYDVPMEVERAVSW